MPMNNAPSSHDSPSSMRSVERLLSILSLFVNEHHGLTTQDIIALTGLPQSTCFRLLRCLVDAEMLEKSGTTYSVGRAILRMAQGGELFERLRRIAVPCMRALSHTTGRCVGLSVVNKDNFRICIALIDNANEEIRLSTPLNTPLPLHKGATGKMLWAHLSEPKQLQVYRENAHEIPESWNEIRTLLSGIRDKGYFFSSNERLNGACSLAAPIVNASGDFVAALTISAVQLQFTPAEVQQYTRHLLETTRKISLMY